MGKKKIKKKLSKSQNSSYHKNLEHWKSLEINLKAENSLKVEICPNCNSEMENKDKCELCGWERIICIHKVKGTCWCSDGRNVYCKDYKPNNYIEVGKNK